MIRSWPNTRFLARATISCLALGIGVAGCGTGRDDGANTDSGTSPQDSVPAAAETVAAVMEPPLDSTRMGPFELDHPLFYYGGSDSTTSTGIAWAVAWPGAERGIPPPVEGTLILHVSGRCDHRVRLSGPADTTGFGPAEVMQVPGAAIEPLDHDTLPRDQTFAFSPGLCPAGGPVEVDDLNYIQGRLWPVLLPEIQDSLQHVLETSVAISPSTRGKVWEFSDGRRESWDWSAVQVDSAELDDHILSGARIYGDAQPDSVRLVYLWMAGHFLRPIPLEMVDIDADARREVVVGAYDSRQDPQRSGLIFLRQNDAGEWIRWQQVWIWFVYSYRD